MTEGVTILSKKIYGLHMLILWICVAIAVVVFGAMIYSLVKFRKSQGAEADKTLVHSTKVEIIWTVIPIAILVFMAVPIAKTLIEIEDMGKVDVNIKVTGYQWKWEYEYLGQNVSFFSTLKRDSDAARQLGSGIDPKTVPNYLLDVDNVLVIPAGTEDPLPADRAGRHPRLVGAGLRHEEGRHPGLRERDLGAGGRRQDRHVPRPVRRALRPRSRLHAHRGRSEVAGRIRRLAARQAGRAEARGRGARVPSTAVASAAPPAVTQQ